jgi:pimeloyl-ACP methyl ester carboxylesterase
MLLGALGTSGTPAEAQTPEHLPIVFVHGYLGSGAQYRTQAMRFASNGWPAERISAIDYTGFTATMLDDHIDAVREEFGTDQVYVAAHSLGTAVMAGYLGNPTQSAKVAAYAALDGIGATCSGGTRCTAISAASMGQSHVEAATSAESFARQYQHFTGQAPATTDVLPEDDGEIEIGGKALEFSTNAPIPGVSGEVYEVNPDTGLREGWPDGPPEATFDVAADGSFGPISGLDGEATYEIAMTQEDGRTMHFYYQPFIRSTSILRLQLATPSSASFQNTNRGPNHSVAVIVRYREWWAGNAAARDTLEVGTYAWAGIQPPVNVLGGSTSNTIAGIHLHDDAASPRESSLGPLPYFSTQPFQTGVDIYMPSAPNGPNGILTFENAPRGDASNPQTIHALNWPSDNHGITIEFNDFVQ